jgi:hypothetical protein
MEESGRKEGIGATTGGPLICLAVEGDGLMGPYASYDHEVGEEARVRAAQGVDDESDVGGGGRQICVAEVVCVVWHRAIPLSAGCFWRKEAF